MDEQSFVQLLEHVLMPDTSIVKKATVTLHRDYYSKPEVVPALFSLLRTHRSPQIRQLSAVEARNLIPQYWRAQGGIPSGIPPDLKPQLRESILNSTISEPNSLVKHSCARVISSIAKIDLPLGEWLDLPGLLLRVAASGEAENRDVGVYILFTLLESLEEAVADRWRDFLPLFARTINDQESMSVRLNTLLALGKMAEFLNSEEHADGVAAFREVLPAMVAVLKESIDTGDEEKANPAFEVFQTLLIVDPALISSHFGDLVQFFSELSISTKVNDDFRSKAINFLISCLRYKKLKMQALRIGEQLTLRAVQIVTEFKELEDTDDMTPSRSALGLLDYLSASLPPSQVVVPLLNILPHYTASADPEYRKAAVLALGMCVEGAPDFIATQIASIFPVVLNLLSDPEARVRQAALHTVAQLADDLSEDMGKEHARLIPALIGMLDSNDGLVIWKAACNAIDAVLIGIDQKDVEGYLPALMPRLSSMFQRDDLKLKAAVVGGIGSSAQAAKGSFVPYFPATMSTLFPFVSIKDSEEELDLRGVVVDAMGAIAEAVGMQAFTPYVEPLMQSATDALSLNHPRLRETSFMFFSIMSKVYGEEFTHFLSGVTAALFHSLEMTETDIDEVVEDLAAGAVITSVGASGTQKVSLGEGVEVGVRSTDTDEDNDDEDALWNDLTAVSAVALEKEVAAEVIGEVLSHCKHGYLPYLEKTVELLVLKAQHPYEGVRKASISTLWRAYATFWQVSREKGAEMWLPGLPLKVQPSPELQRLGNVVITCTLANWKGETDRGSVTDICQNIAETLKLCGPAILVDPAGAIVLELSRQLVLILIKQHVCQLDDENEELPELHESSEYDWVLIESAMDVVIGLAMALGSQFGEMWKLLGPNLIKYASSSEAVERSASVGVIADCIKYMEEGCSQYTDQLMKLLLHRLSDEDPEAKSNAAYAMGMLCLKSQAVHETTRNYPAILTKLEPLLQEKNHRMLDNACGCIARMVTAHPNSVVLGEILPALASVLPLKVDYEENEPIYKMLVQLYKNSNQTVFGATQQLVPIIASVLGPPEGQLTDDTRKQLIELVQFLHKHDPEVIQGYDYLISLATAR